MSVAPKDTCCVSKVCVQLGLHMCEEGDNLFSVHQKDRSTFKGVQLTASHLYVKLDS